MPKEPADKELDYLLKLFREKNWKNLENSCIQELELYPESAKLYNLLGASFFNQKHLNAALVSYNQAIRLQPDYAVAFYNRGNIHRDSGSLLRALADYELACKYNPKYALAFFNLGNILRSLCRFDESIENYKIAINLHPTFHEALCNLGLSYKDIGKMKLALKSQENAIKLQPLYSQSHFNRSELIKYKSDDPFTEVIEKSYKSLDIINSDRKFLSFTLARIYEDLHQYKKSFRYLKEGNRLRKLELPYKISEDVDLIKKIKRISGDLESLSMQAFENKREDKIPIFIVGMMRSGTTLVEQIIASHTKVFGAGELETIRRSINPIFSKLLKNNLNKTKIESVDIIKIRTNYLKHLNNLNFKEQIVTDKMPGNFRWIGFILKAFPEAKIINLQRDPRAVCWSIYKHCFSEPGNRYAYDMKDIVRYYKLYMDLMDYWKKCFPNKIYDVFYENLTEDQKKETIKLLNFCDLNLQENCLDFQKTQRVVRTASASQVRKKLYKGSSNAWKSYEKDLQPLIKGLKIKNLIN
jgi:tetratricopeptide (TPR) repeat protein